MRKKFFQKLMAAATAMLLTIGSVLPAAAADVTSVDGQCNITLHLYGSNTMGTVGDGTVNPELPEDSTPIAGATFKYAQVGNVVQYNDGNDVGIRYEITDVHFANLLGINGTFADTVTTAGSAYIVPDYLLQELFLTKTSGNVDSFVKDLSKLTLEETKPTSDAGEVKLTGNTGLYVFIGGTMPTTVTSHVTPFLVSAPMPNVDGDGWNTDIHVYPKVTNSEIKLDKVAEQNGVSGKHILVESNKDISYTVTLTVPGKVHTTSEVADFEKFVLSDTMANGLKPVKGKSSLKIVNGKGEEQQISVKDDDITVEIPSAENNFTTSVIFNESGLEKLNELLDSGDVTLTLSYCATLGEGAALGEVGNKNKALLTYQRVGGTEGSVESIAYVHTYGLDVTKKLSDQGGFKGKKIEFTLERKIESEDEDETYVPLKLTKVTQNNVTINWIDESGASATDTLLVAEDGTLKLYGLLPGTYRLTETKSAAGYTKLDKPIEIVIAPPVNNAYDVQNATATADGQPMSFDSGSKAFQLTVVNTKIETGFTLPHTGGAGMLFALAVGFGLVGFSVLVLVSRRKGNNE